MRASNFFTLALCAGLSSSCTAYKSDIFSGVYFVKLEAQPAEVASIVAEIGSMFELEILHVYDSASEGFSVRIPHLIVPELENLEVVDSIIEDVRTDYAVPIDPDGDVVYGDSGCLWNLANQWPIHGEPRSLKHSCGGRRHGY